MRLADDVILLIFFGAIGVIATIVMSLISCLSYKSTWIEDSNCIGTFTFKRFYNLYLANPKGWYLHDHTVKYHKGMNRTCYGEDYYIAFNNWFEYRKYKRWRESDANEKIIKKNSQKMLEVMKCIKEDLKEEEEKYQAEMKLDLIRNFMHHDDLKALFNAIVDNKKCSYLKVSSEDKDIEPYLNYIKKFLNITWIPDIGIAISQKSYLVKWDGTYTDPSTWVTPEEGIKEEKNELPL